MGRKRKSDAPMKIRSVKQIKREESPEGSHIGSSLLKVGPETTASEAASSEVTNRSSSSKKPWIEKCQQWVVEQQDEVAEPPPLEPEEEDDQPMDEPAEIPTGSAAPLRDMLKHYNEKEILNSVMYECEWLKCGFETTDDIAYISHVEAHVFQYLAKPEDGEDLVCFWDVCDFRTTERSDLESHVHFHVYHNRIKTYGASLSRIISIPRCNGDSRRRNCIDSFKTKFTCEWADCEEPFIKAQQFFAHVNYHVQDQFPLDKKSSKEHLQCQWDACTQTYKRRSLALEHVRKHSTERNIGCYTCGAMFGSRLKYIDHCKRQVEYHNREFSCPDCDKLFATKQLMIDHRNIHNKKFQCPLCPMKWPSRKALACHIRYRHVEEKPFQCKICMHRTVTKADLEEHVLTHDERRMFRCEEFGCDATYKCQRSLKKHVDAVHYGTGPGIYACHLCPIQYKAGATLSRHLIRAHNYQRPPGYNRFTYRANQHGVLQLSSATSTDEKQPLAIVDPDSNPPPPAPSISIKKDIKIDDSICDDEASQSQSATFTSFAIEKMEPINRNTFSIELQPAEELPKPAYRKRTNTCTTNGAESEHTNDWETASADNNMMPPLDMKIEIEEPTKSSSVVSKSIDDFKVMKRYLKLEKPEKAVVISYEEMDSTGSVIRSETVQTTELNLENLLKKDA
ncbi:histone H4 transcription factor isoform X3 [Aedes albopictus]